MNLGDRIFLPITVQELPSRKPECFSNEEEDFICSLELHKVLEVWLFACLVMSANSVRDAKQVGWPPVMSQAQPTPSYRAQASAAQLLGLIEF